MLDFNCGTQNVENGFNCGTGTSVLLSNNLFDLTNGLYITTNDAQVDCLGGKIDVRQTDGGINTNTGFNIKVDDNLTGIASGPNPNSVVKVTSQTEPIFSIPCEWINSDHAFDFFTQKNTFEKNTTKQLWGADQVIGHPEKGSSFFSGEGIPYSSDITVFSVSNQIGLEQPPSRYIWDSAGPTIKSSLETFCNNISQTPPPSSSSNLNITDITESAQQDDSNNFTFNSTSAGEILMWCSNRKNESCEFLKHWSINLTSVSNAVIDDYLVNDPDISNGGLQIDTIFAENIALGGPYLDNENEIYGLQPTGLCKFEVYSNEYGWSNNIYSASYTNAEYSGGVLNKAEGENYFGAMSVQTNEQNRYANQVMMRSNSIEDIRFGINSETPWDSVSFTDANGNTTQGYWMRAVLLYDCSQLPTFNQLKLEPATFSLNNIGQRLSFGLSMWRQTIIASQGTGNGAATFSTEIVDEPNDFDGIRLRIARIKLNTTNDYVNYIVQLPNGICTAYPLKLKWTIVSDVNTVDWGAIRIRTKNIPIAGNLTPYKGDRPDMVYRSDDYTPYQLLSTNPQQYGGKLIQDFIVDTTLVDTTISLTGRKFGYLTWNTSIEELSEGDYIVIEIAATDSNSDFAALNIIAEGVTFSEGIPQDIGQQLINVETYV